MHKPSTYYDYDLFIFTPSVKIYIATAGAEIPWALVNLTKNNPDIYRFYSNFPTEEIQINPRLQEIVYNRQLELDENFDRQRYLRSFEQFAKCGFYSFDKTDISNPRDSAYHLVSYPLNNNDDKKGHRFMETAENLKILGRGHFMNPLIKEIESLNFEPIRLIY